MNSEYVRVFIKNPVTLWMRWLCFKFKWEHRYKEQNLKIGYLTRFINCRFGVYNTLLDNISLTNVELNDFTYICSNTVMYNTKMGKFCSIGPNTQCGIGSHPSQRFVSTHPIFFSVRKQSQITFADKNYYLEHKGVVIGNDVWIGANAIILDGIKISDGAIIGAGAVVTRNVPPYSIVGGVPAIILKYRFEAGEIESLLNFKWWEKDMDWLKQNYKLFHDIRNFVIKKQE